MRACAWENLPTQDWEGAFDAVFCVGSSLAHAAGKDARRRALTAMAAVLRNGGTLAITSRNWEQVRAAGSGLEVARQLVQRAGGPGRHETLRGDLRAAGLDPMTTTYTEEAPRYAVTACRGA